jgi:hypothetical protein
MPVAFDGGYCRGRGSGMGLAGPGSVCWDIRGEPQWPGLPVGQAVSRDSGTGSLEPRGEEIGHFGPRATGRTGAHGPATGVKLVAAPEETSA